MGGRSIQKKLITFSDAGFASLQNSHSIEGTFVVLGQAISRGGIIRFEWQMIDRRCAEIHRVCRSSLADETHADVSACDQATWLQMLWIEITTGEYNIEKYCHPTEYPLRNPFSPAPTDAVVTRDLRQQTNVKINRRPNVDATHGNATDFGNPGCGGNVGESPDNLYEPILLIDSRSLYTAILRTHPRSEDKCAKIVINHLRDLQTLLRISHIDATTNLADLDTKHAGSLDILAKFTMAGEIRRVICSKASGE